MVVAGGKGVDGEALATVELLHVFPAPRDGSWNGWVTLPPMLAARTSFTLTVVDSAVVAVGGNALAADGTPVGPAIETYSFATRAWTAVHTEGATEGMRPGTAACALPSGALLVAGGHSRARRSVESVSSFEPASFEPAGDALPCGAFDTTLRGGGQPARCERMDGRGLESEGASIGDVWLARRRAPRMAVARSRFGLAALADGRVVAVGGCGDDIDAQRTPPRHRSNPTPHRTASASSLSSDGLGRIDSGSAGPSNRAATSAEVYDPGALGWAAISPVPSPREGFSCVGLSDGRLLVAGGVDPRTGEPANCDLVLRLPPRRWSINTHRIQVPALRAAARTVLFVAARWRRHCEHRAQPPEPHSPRRIREKRGGDPCLGGSGRVGWDEVSEREGEGDACHLPSVPTEIWLTVLEYLQGIHFIGRNNAGKPLGGADDDDW